MATGESATAIARDLNIRCKFLYAWRAEGRGSNAVPRQPKAAEVDPHEQEVAQLKARIAELEQFTGKQAAELDFFVAALRNIKGTRPSNATSSAKGSTK